MIHCFEFSHLIWYEITKWDKKYIRKGNGNDKHVLHIPYHCLNERVRDFPIIYFRPLRKISKTLKISRSRFENSAEVGKGEQFANCKRRLWIDERYIRMYISSLYTTIWYSKITKFFIFFTCGKTHYTILFC